MKTCTRCSEEKSLPEFRVDRRYRGGVKYWCRLCENAYERERRARPGASRDRSLAKAQEWNLKAAETGYFWEHHLLKKYGMTRDDYESRLTSQGGVCALCGTDTPGGRGVGRFHVDHDHRCCLGARTCGRCVRGLLCGRCNQAVERIDAFPGWAVRADQYVASFELPISSPPQ